jgi:hypothetical protein
MNIAHGTSCPAEWQKAEAIMNLFGKPVLPRNLEAALEECGPEIIRPVLLNGWANGQGMPKALEQIANPSQERAYALAWR